MTVPHYGKREPGALTAASPGDTLYFNFGAYNDSGDSEVVTGLAVTDIEVIKNGSATVRATDSGYSLISDTGMVGDRAGLYRFSVQLFNTADDATFYASGSWYQVFVDSVTIDGKTVRFWCGSFEIGRPRVNAYEIFSDTGAANQLKNAFANGFNDTGVTNRFDRIQFEVDTGLRAHMDDSDTGIKDTIADLDTGLRALLALRDTGAIATAVWAGDTGLRDHITNVDTGLTARLNTIAFDVDTGLRAQISDVDTGLHDAIADLDTGLRDFITDTDTGLEAHITLRLNELDTGIRDYIDNTDTGLRAHMTSSGGTDTGRVANAVWNSLRSDHITAGTFGLSDTGINERLTAIEDKTNSLTFTVGGFVDANIQYVNDVQVVGIGDTGNAWRPA